jgi:hypothetical protein
MERLKQIVNKYNEENDPLLDDIETGNPRIVRLKKTLKYNGLNAVIFVSSVIWIIIGGVKLYQMV